MPNEVEGSTRTLFDRITDETVNEMGAAELHAIARSRGYIGRDDSERSMGVRALRAFFIERQDADDRLVGKGI